MKKYMCHRCHEETGDCLAAYCGKCVTTKGFPKSTFWNNRVMVSADGHAEIREVHYSPDGKIEMWTEGPKAMVGNDVADLLNEIRTLAADCLLLELRSCAGLILSEPELEAAIRRATP